ncbi:phospho-N-acetylmuramoyl-pentapeptide-transferase [Alphaproteobacteria bacterium]|nr:phospho-N-acetylmuramoyl-pentapeptide-transferase [Alphaproteobacteria bacterium]MDA9590541.1 phospho-N-acetylmuramoyl-pentapeptide-transferase [Alphaproteobacteria bacterium]MDB2405876.1 phospho-N-acetylmuramoyl-pentapeptide-transferase [Alphaproteobacteria bacterium]MDB2406223.1 phospho-N-acetylmuramoyl-pentapeptide-transferase [Alphaproteobacteria bacterium]MDB2462035.1 phospho-N-acetylmuramoyl-pentapeptide-transferase [Alphaproteobacteria bacterium]
MFYYLTQVLGDLPGGNLFNYITFRAGGATMTALLISFVLAPWMINTLRARQVRGQPIRADGPQSHLTTKVGTPTMGGLLILIASIGATLLWGNLQNIFLWIALLTTVGFGLIGFADDYLKLRGNSSDGVPGRIKLVLEAVIAIVAVIFISANLPSELATSYAVPFLKDVLLPFGLPLYLIAGLIVIVGASNSVNLTDGLDGLAIVPTMIAATSFGFIAYLVGNAIFANYLQVHYVPGTGELAVFCAALIGSGLGFLWYNAPPAAVFMGDTGSLALGAALGTIAIITKHELVLAIIGGLFVLEAVSVIVQVASFKLTGKRVFAMAPLHHHFEQRGWAESTIVIRFWIISVVLALVGLATLKLR